MPPREGPFAGLMQLATAPAPASVVDASSWFGGSSSLISTNQPNSNSGVPAASSVATGGGASPGGIIAWASTKVGNGSVFAQPIFWAIAAGMLSIIMLSHVAHVQIRE